MKTTSKFLIIITGFILLSAVFLPSAQIYAQQPPKSPFSGATGEACRGANLNKDDQTCNSANAGERVSQTIENIVNLLTIIVGIAAIIVIVINGLKFITSNGDSNAISSARNGIIYAIVGLIIVALSQVIVRFIVLRI